MFFGGQECSPGSCSGCWWQGSVKLGDLPKDSGPRVRYRVCGLEVRDVGSVGEGSSFNPMVFFSNSLVVDDNGGSPQEVQEVKWAGSDTTAFV